MNEIKDDWLLPNFMDDLQRHLVSQVNNKLEEYIKNNLAHLGYEFASQIEFYDFCTKRITRVSSINDPHYYDFYLDIMKENGGTLIGGYSDKVKIIDKGKKVTAIIG